MILVVSLSPAWQRTRECPRLALGAVNRAVRVTKTASDKGVNVARPGSWWATARAMSWSFPAKGAGQSNRPRFAR